jgi:hypothetical protein
MNDKRRFSVLLNDLRKGEDFDKSFSAAYGGSPSQLAAAWARSGRR